MRCMDSSGEGATDTTWWDRCRIGVTWASRSVGASSARSVRRVAA